MRYLAVYERSTKNATFRHLRDSKKRDISPFVREVQEVRYLTVYERSIRNKPQPDRMKRR